MKTFIYTTKSVQQRTGGQKVTASVYEVKRNTPNFVLEVTWNTTSFKGETSAIMNELAVNAQLPAKYVQGYYHDYAKKTFRIIGL